MSVASQQQVETAAGDEGSDLRNGVRPLFDIAGLDLTRRPYDRDAIAKLNPHRGEMALLDAIVWTTPDFKQGLALKQIKPTEFWVPGHFPAKPMFPGVLMIEAGAQLACFLYNVRQTVPRLVAFLRIENASFRNMVSPGDD